MTATLSFKAFLTGKAYCGLKLSPLVAAIADASEGKPVKLGAHDCEEYFGCAPSALPASPRRTVAVRAGRGGGKTSRLLAPKALHAAWTVPAPLRGKGEELFAVIV